MADIRSYLPLNFELIENPINWFIILLMLAIAGLAASLIFHQASTTAD